MQCSIRGLPQWLSGKESACKAGDAGDVGLMPGLGRPPGEGNSYPLQYSGLENSMDYSPRVQRVRRDRDFHFTAPQSAFLFAASSQM